MYARQKVTQCYQLAKLKSVNLPISTLLCMVFSLICPTFHQNHVLSHPKPWQCTRLLILVIAYWLLSTFSWPVKHLPPMSRVLCS